MDPACTVPYGSDGGADASGAGPDSAAALLIPEAFVLAQVGPGTGGAAVCGFASDDTFVQIGVPTPPLPMTITSGDLQPGSGTVHVNCKVGPSGGGFNVQLSAEVDGTNGGSFTVVGQVAVSGGTGLQGGFTSAGMGTFSDPDCSITFTYIGNPVPSALPITAGRIWAHIDCPTAMQAGTFEIGEDGGMTPRVCDAHADFMFENCE